MTTPIPDISADTIAPVEPVVSASGPERFERAGAISDRLVDNIETVVYGKRSEIKLVLTALACDGGVFSRGGAHGTRASLSRMRAEAYPLFGARIPI